MENPVNITFRTLTPLWTGGVDQTCDRLHETGLIGSLRWWYEAMVRGLGGYACDPTSEDRCEYAPRKPDPPEKQLCAACYLFGCTGWGRKFRLQVLSTPELVAIDNIEVIKDGQAIGIQPIPLRPISEEEWCLLQLTLRLIDEYGAMGGKTIFKPSDELGRGDQFHHRDLGSVEIEFAQEWSCAKSLDELRNFVQKGWRKGKHKIDEHDCFWASLTNFWCVKGRYLARQNVQQSSFNLVLGRKQDKSEKERQGRRIIRWSDLLENRDDAVSQWLAGRQQESKKVFSFKNPARTFGFINSGVVSFEEIKERLKKAWPDFNAQAEFLTGEQVLKALFSPEGGKQ